MSINNLIIRIIKLCAPCPLLCGSDCGGILLSVFFFYTLSFVCSAPIHSYIERVVLFPLLLAGFVYGTLVFIRCCKSSVVNIVNFCGYLDMKNVWVGCFLFFFFLLLCCFVSLIFCVAFTQRGLSRAPMKRTNDR